MANKKEILIPSTNGSNKLHVIEWAPKGNIKAILQLSHGMVEYIDRYDKFAKYLNERGILVIGGDHLGHGLTAANDEELGYFPAEDGSKTVVDDLYEITKYTKNKYPKVPYYILGHSMGSFMVRRYIMTYGNEVDGTIIMGTGGQPKLLIYTARTIVKVLTKLKGSKHRSKLVNKLSFGTYNNKFKPVRTEYDWLTRDEGIVDAYKSNKYCTFLFTLNGYETLFNTLHFINKKENIDKIPKDMPIFFVAGDKDPVGANGVGVNKVFNQYKNLGIKDIKIKLYKDARHEILNEINCEEVFEDIHNWLQDNLK